jgi:[acyl-carrier-protein] S-malonyltransferase
MGCSLGDLARSVYSGAYLFEDAVYNHVYYTRAIAGIDKIGANIGILAPKGQPFTFTPEDFKWFDAMEVDVSRLTARFLNVGGRFRDLEQIKTAARERGWNVMNILDYPAHSRYILPFVERVAQDALRVRVNAPKIPMFSSFSVQPLVDPELIKREFLLSITMPIHWHVAVETLVATHGVRKFVNIGPCRSLSGLMRDIPVEVEVIEAADL